MISEIVSILTDRGRHSREYHSANIPPDDIFPLVDVWSGIIEEAERAGFEVKVGTGYFSFRRSDGSWGSFAAHEGGAAMARDFLGGAA